MTVTNQRDRGADQPRLPPNQHMVAAGKWPVIGEREPADVPAVWTLAVGGLVGRPTVFTTGDLRSLPQVRRTVDIHCVTRWSKLDAVFGGVLLEEVLHRCRPSADARFASFVAHSERGHSSSLPLAGALELGTLLALDFEGAPLPSGHGGPVRGVVPGRYFYKSVKWLARIELLAEDRLGHWEADAGYHNHADPWAEERYVGGGLSKREAAALIASRDFSGRDLLSLAAAGRDLCRLKAVGAQLRNADFTGCDLREATFAGSNCSNARFGGADLRGGTFAEADVEGADFAGADLRGCDLRLASLFGVTFVTAAGAAAVDATTLVNPDQLDALTPEQRQFLADRLRS